MIKEPEPLNFPRGTPGQFLNEVNSRGRFEMTPTGSRKR